MSERTCTLGSLAPAPRAARKNDRTSGDRHWMSTTRQEFLPKLAVLIGVFFAQVEPDQVTR